MPKIIDSVARFEFFREACFTLVRDEGVGGLARAEMARVLGISVSTVRRALAPDASLAGLAADVVAERRRGTWWRTNRGPP